MKGFEKCKHILAFLLVIMLTVQQTSIITLADELSTNTVTAQSQEETISEENTEDNGQEDPASDSNSSEGSEEAAETPAVPEPTVAAEPTAVPETTDESGVENYPEQNEETTEEVPAEETQEATEDNKAAVQTAETSSSDTLNNFVTGVVLEGAAKGENNSYQIEADQDYKITLSFAEKRNLQFDNGGTLYYILPAGVTLADSFKGSAHYFDIGNLKNNTFTYDEASNRLIIHLNTSDTENYEKYKAAADAEFSLWLEVRFGETVTQIDFGDDIRLDVTVNTDHNLRISKSASYDENKGCINYEIKVISDGNNHDVVLTDTLSGSLVQMYSAGDVNTIWSNKKGDLKSAVSPTVTGNTMSLQIPSMENGEEITVKYSAKVDYEQVTVTTAATLENTRNSVSAKSREATNEVTASSGISVDKMYKPIIKKTASRNNTVVTYTITINENYRYDVSGKEIKDTITQNAGYIKYSGDGITVRKFDDSGNQVGSDSSISWAQLKVEKETTKEWTYTLPSEAGKYKYTITYTADLQENNSWGNLTIKNRAEFTGEKNGDNADVTIKPTFGSFYINKSGEILRDETTKKKQIKWTVAFDTVANMSYDNCWINDELPSAWIDNQRYSDSLLEDTVEVTGLSEDERYEIEKYTENNINKFKIKFYYKQDGNEVAGLKTSDRLRRITITYLSEPNQTWLDKSDKNNYREHKNTAKLYTDGKKSYFTRSASVDLYKRDVDIEKKAYIQSTDNNGLSVIRYEVVITGIDSDTITVQDIFDKDQLVYYTDNNLKPTIGFDNYWNFKTNRGGKLTYTETDTGAQFVISEIPKNSHKDYYPHCKLTYYLKVNGQKALESIATSSEGGKVRNTAKIGDETSISDIAVAGSLSPVKKEMIEGNENNGYVATYTLTVNENQRKYGTEEYLNVDDVMENVWLTDIDSMSITTEPADRQKDVVFTLDKESNSLHFKVPNETKVVITYQAKWTGKGWLNHKNTVSVFGYTSEKSVWKNASAGGSGSFNNYAINIYKSDADDSLKALEGAVFKLQEFIGDSWTDVTGKDGAAVTVTTDDKGKAHIEGHQDSLGWVLYTDVKYRLVETQAPEGYEKLSEEDSPVFTISKDGKHGATDGTVYYSNGDTIYIADQKTPEYDVEISKVEAAGGQELAGAKLTITDASGATVESWTSGEAKADQNADGSAKAHKVRLTAGTYTLTEEAAPEGYKTAGSIIFTVGLDGKIKIGDKEVEKVTMTDAPISVSIKKTDIVDGKELAGAKLQILDKNKNVATNIRGEKLEWVSGTTAKVIEGLKAGETYYLHEETAPTGYTLASDTTFTLKTDGTIDTEKTTTIIKDDVLLVQDSMIRSEKASLKVTKTLTYNGMELGAADQTFYVTLYGDENCTNRISDVKSLQYKNSDTATAEFKDLEIGRKYYVSECDAEGTALTSGILTDASKTAYIANFPEGNTVVVGKADETKEIKFQNEFMNIPDGFYKVGKLNITKKVFDADGKAKNSDEVFYAGIFDDEGFTKLSEHVSQNIVALNLNGGSTVTAQVKVSMADGETVTLYVTEVDADGKPVSGTEGFQYEVSVDETKVTLDSNNMTGNITISNQEQKEESEETKETKETKETEETTVEKTSSETSSETSSAPEKTSSTSTKSVKTGDNTPIAAFVILLIAAITAIVAGIYFKRHKK